MSHRTLYLICPNLHPPTKPAASPKSLVENHSSNLSPPSLCSDPYLLSSKQTSLPHVSPYSHPAFTGHKTAFWRTNLIMSLFCQTLPLSWVIKRNGKYKIKTKSKYRWLDLKMRKDLPNTLKFKIHYYKKLRQVRNRKKNVPEIGLMKL